MNRFIVITGMILLWPAARPIAAQSGQDLFQRALVAERAEGNPEEALLLYERVVREHGGSRELAARAHLQAGLLYEKLGAEDLARRELQAVLSRYPDQTAVVTLASARLATWDATEDRATLEIRQILAGDEVDIRGEPSPDGRYLSFVDWDTGDLALHDLTTGKNRRLTDKGSWSESIEQAEFSVFSSSGERIAFNWLREGETYDLRTVDRNGSNLKVLLSDPSIEYVRPYDWHPDDDQILVALSRRVGAYEMAVVSTLDGTIRTLKSLEWRLPQKARFSADGSRIAYDLPSADNAPERDIFLISADGSGEIPAVVHPADDFLLGWAPIGEKLVFASDRSGSMRTWIIDIENGQPVGEPMIVQSEFGSIWPLGFTRDGAYHYVLSTGMDNVYETTLNVQDGGVEVDPKPLTQRFVGANGIPRWSPDGTRVAFERSSQRGLRSTILVIHDVESQSERQLVTGLRSLWDFTWSADGTGFLALGRDAKQRSGIFLVDAETATVSPILLPGPRTRVTGMVSSSDGTTLFYQRLDQDVGRHSIVRRSLLTGDEEELLTQDLRILNLALSPDERHVFYILREADNSAKTLALVPSDGGSARVLLRMPMEGFEWLSSPVWSSDGRYVLLAKRFENLQTHILRLDVATGEVMRFPVQMEHISHLSLHPDGRRLVFRAGRFVGSVWVMRNFLPASDN